MSDAQLLSYGQPGFAVAAALIKILVFMVLFAMGLASLLTWLERRQSAMMQDRLPRHPARRPAPGFAGSRVQGLLQ
ncbi:MAG: hypothetical protein ACLP66_16405 [Polyangia bacterium]|jgi:NADH:ubiquinone oxidoreductase subunit H